MLNFLRQSFKYLIPNEAMILILIEKEKLKVVGALELRGLSILGMSKTNWNAPYLGSFPIL